MRPIAPTVKDVVLIGGGHSHVEVLRSFGKRPVAGARLTLVTKDLQTPYSGMLPGYVAGYYNYDDVHIDLCTLTRFAQSRLIHAEATGLDIKSRRVLFRDRPPLNYDVLSIDIGSTPKLNDIPGAKEHTTAVKPISTFIQRFHAMLQQTSPTSTSRPLTEEDDYRIRKMSGISLDLNRSSRSPSPAPSFESQPKGSINRRVTTKRQLGQRGFCIAVVGGGAGGVELAFSIHHRLRNEVSLTPQQTISEPVVKLISRQRILMDYPSNVRSMILRNFEEKGIEVCEKNGVRDVKEGILTLCDGKRVEFDGCLWCTEASAAPWLRTTDLTIDQDGFIKINDFLQPFGGPGEVFAAGDIATSVTNPRPKAGVFAVRQGPILAKNIRRFLQGEELIPYIPQSTYLSLISTGDKHCIAHKGWFSWQGSALWKLKDTIDRLFMNKYSIDLPEFEERSTSPVKSKTLDEVNASSLLEKQAAILSRESRMRCAGCGGKLGMNTLKNVLTKVYNFDQQSTIHNHHAINKSTNDDNSENEDSVQEERGGSPPSRMVDLSRQGPAYDDAAVLQRPPEGYLLLQTTDMLKSFVSDPFLFGQITALHCLSDIYAMGGMPKTVLATAMVPFAAENKMEGDLIQLMSGAKKVCDEACCEIVGGHSCEGQDLSLGFSVLGLVQEGQQLIKTGLKSEESLILTKPLGTGLILAAEMRRKAKAAWIETMIETMLLSNDSAGEIFRKFEASACTDVTGFGLLGHMSEMMMSGEISVKIDSHSVPYLPGAEICAKSGILSSLFSQNSRVRDQIANFEAVKDDWRFRVLVDPQTSGGLLASVPKQNTELCLKALQEAGYTSASLIGRTMDSRVDPSPMIHFNVETRQ